MFFGQIVGMRWANEVIHINRFWGSIYWMAIRRRWVWCWWTEVWHSIFGRWRTILMFWWPVLRWWRFRWSVFIARCQTNTIVWITRWIVITSHTRIFIQCEKRNRNYILLGIPNCGSHTHIHNVMHIPLMVSASLEFLNASKYESCTWTHCTPITVNTMKNTLNLFMMIIASVSFKTNLYLNIFCIDRERES